jgi:metallo-beta-lactamase class B
MKRFVRGAALGAAVFCSAAAAAAPPEWTAPQAPFRIHGDTYYVGTRGLGAILIASPQGHVLIDVPMAENAKTIEANIRALGFRVEDVRLILNSHAHFDHAGGIAALAHDSGAKVRASAASARALRSGGDDPDDPQHGMAAAFAPVAVAATFADGETVRLGPIALTAHLTPGHTPGSTTWSWRSCEGGRCLDLVYADSLTLLSAAGYRYGDPAHPERVAGFRRGLDTIAALPCDVLITPHPEASGFLDRVARRDAGEADALVDRTACRRYAEAGGARLQARLAEEKAAQRR